MLRERQDVLATRVEREVGVRIEVVVRDTGDSPAHTCAFEGDRRHVTRFGTWEDRVVRAVAECEPETVRSHTFEVLEGVVTEAEAVDDTRVVLDRQRQDLDEVVRTTVGRTKLVDSVRVVRASWLLVCEVIAVLGPWVLNLELDEVDVVRCDDFERSVALVVWELRRVARVLGVLEAGACSVFEFRIDVAADSTGWRRIELDFALGVGLDVDVVCIAVRVRVDRTSDDSTGRDVSGSESTVGGVTAERTGDVDVSARLGGAHVERSTVSVVDLNVVAVTEVRTVDVAVGVQRDGCLLTIDLEVTVPDGVIRSVGLVTDVGTVRPDTCVVELHRESELAVCCRRRVSGLPEADVDVSRRPVSDLDEVVRNAVVVTVGEDAGHVAGLAVVDVLRTSQLEVELDGDDRTPVIGVHVRRRHVVVVDVRLDEDLVGWRRAAISWVVEVFGAARRRRRRVRRRAERSDFGELTIAGVTGHNLVASGLAVWLVDCVVDVTRVLEEVVRVTGTFVVPVDLTLDLDRIRGRVRRVVDDLDGVVLCGVALRLEELRTVVELDRPVFGCRQRRVGDVVVVTVGQRHCLDQVTTRVVLDGQGLVVEAAVVDSDFDIVADVPEGVDGRRRCVVRRLLHEAVSGCTTGRRADRQTSVRLALARTWVEVDETTVLTLRWVVECSSGDHDFDSVTVCDRGL